VRTLSLLGQTVIITLAPIPMALVLLGGRNTSTELKIVRLNRIKNVVIKKPSWTQSSHDIFGRKMLNTPISTRRTSTNTSNRLHLTQTPATSDKAKEFGIKRCCVKFHKILVPARGMQPPVFFSSYSFL